MLTYKPRLKIYKYKARSVCTFNPRTLNAYSYDHWCLFKRIDGVNILNNYAYSHTTSKHIRMLRTLLRNLGIRINLEITTSVNLKDSDLSLSDWLHNVYRTIAKLKVENARKGAREQRIRARKHDIETLYHQASQIVRLGGEVSKTRRQYINDSAKVSEEARLKRLKEVYALKAEERKQAKFQKNINNVLGPTESEAV